MKEKLIKARTRIIIDNPELAPLLFGLSFKADNVDGIYAIGEEIVYNPSCNWSVTDVQNFMYNVIDDISVKGVARFSM